MIKITQLWLFLCAATVLSYAASKMQSEICYRSTNKFPEQEFWCFGPNDVIMVNLKTNDEIRITCNDSQKFNIDDFNPVRDVLTFQKFDTFYMRQCHIPDISFKEFFAFLGISDSFRRIQFESNQVIGDQLKSFHFENLTSVKDLRLSRNKISNLPESFLRDLHHLTKLFIDDNAISNLPDKLFKYVPELQKLDVGCNNLTTLGEDLFKYVPKLKHLNLFKNQLKTITKAGLANLPSLESLDLVENGIEYLEDGVFDNMKNLTRLNLNCNNLTRVPEKLFANNRKLIRISMVEILSYQGSTLPSGLFANLTSLVDVILDMNHLISLPENLFGNCIELVTISLKNNSLTSLPGNLFKDTSALKELDLSLNKLESLDGALFQSLKNLVKLNLRKNRLATLSSEVFSSLSSLIELDLSWNYFVDFEDDLFGALQKLVNVNLSYNRLTFNDSLALGYSPLKKCLKLETLILRNNSLAKVFLDWTQSFTYLKELDLSFNKLNNLATNDLIFLSANYPITINMSNNEIQTIDVKDLELHVKFQCSPPPCAKDAELPHRGKTVIVVQNNPLECDCTAVTLASYFQRKMFPLVYELVELKSNGVFCHSPDELRNVSMEEVDLLQLQCSLDDFDKSEIPQAGNCPSMCNCRVRTYDHCVVVNCTYTGMDEFPRYLPNLPGFHVELLLAYNNFQSLNGSGKLFSLANITKLSLSHNHLKSVDDIELPATMKSLELDNNEIPSLSKRVIQQLNSSTLTYLSLYNNPWRCNCETKYLSHFLGSQIKYKQIPNHLNITCIETGKPIINLSVDDLCEISLTIILICVSLAVFGMLSGAIVALYYIFEHEIKVWLFAHKLLLWLVTEKELDKNKIYDAFVSYSSKDEAFVVDHLIPQLEKGDDHRFKLCIHFRDFLVGEWIPNQIINSVENSRRTIIILSPNFLQSVWARLEFRTAHLKAIKERRARVIVILLKDINVEKLDPELKAYITMNTYIKWGDPKFWDRLRYALPHPQVYSKRKANVAPLTDTELKKQIIFTLDEIYKTKV